MYAIFETGGKQYKVENGDIVFIEKLEAEADQVVTFDKVLAVGGDKSKFKVGSPYVKNTVVTGKVLKNGKSKKITVFTYKPKKNEKRKLGHRQPYTKIQIESIGKPEAEEAAEKPAAKKTASTAAKKTAPAKKTTTTEEKTEAAE